MRGPRSCPACCNAPQLVGVPAGGGTSDTSVMTTTDDNKTIVRDFIGALFTKGDPNAAEDYLSDDFVNHDPPFGATADRAGMQAAGTMFRAAFPDWHSELHLL